MVASKQTRLKLRKGFDKAPMSYRVLMQTQFTDVDKKAIAKGLVAATTPTDAMVLLPAPGKKTPWSLMMLTLTGNNNAYKLCFKGLEVAVFWKRQTSEVTPEPEDPVPEGVLENPDDVWIRFDLFHKSARQLVGAIQDDMKASQNENVSLQIEVAALRRELEANSLTIKTLQGQLKAKQAKKKK